MNHIKVFLNAWNLQQLPVTMRLTSLEWRFLLCSDGKTPVYQIQRRLGITDQERDYVLNRLTASGLLNEKSLSLEELAQITIDAAAPVTEPQTFSEYLQAAATTVPAPEQNQKKTMPAFSPLQKPSIPAPAPTVRAMSLQSVIQFIFSQSSDTTAGHLATYKVFMGINTQLLKRNGITSLRFQDDRFITDTELQDAIAENIKKVLKVTCPEELFYSQPPAGRK